MGIDFQHIFSTHPTQKGDSGPHAAHRKKEFAFDNTTLGAGGYSKVIKAKWKARGSMVVAVKVVRKEAVKDREAYLRIIDIGFPRINEHPNICAGLDWFETPSKFYVTFPILTGGELLERLNTRGRFTEEATKRVMKVILDILAFIHSHGIIHRDIKPDNFLYRTPNSEVEDILLIDFGISKVLPGQNDDDPKNQYEAGGTPGYAAPEVFCGTGYGKNSDLFWRWGHMLQFSQDTLALIQETAHSNINFPEGPFEGVSEQAKLFIRNLLQPPNRRPSAKIAGKHPWLTVTKDDSEVDDHILNAQQADESNVEPIQPHPTVRPSHPLAKQITALSAVNNA